MSERARSCPKIPPLFKLAYRTENQVISGKLRHFEKVTSYPESWYFKETISALWSRSIEKRVSPRRRTKRKQPGAKKRPIVDQIAESKRYLKTKSPD